MNPILAYKITRSEIEQLQFDLPDFDSNTASLPTGLYTTFRTFGERTRVIGLRAHLERLYLPAKLQGLVPVLRKPDALCDILIDLLKALDAPEARVRLIMDTSVELGVIYVLLQSMTLLPPEVYREGVHLDISKTSREKPSLKQTAFITESAFERKRVGGEIFEILLTHKGRILEGMTSNFFYVRDGALCTAGRGILIGVTRQTVLALAKQAGINICVKALPLNKLPVIEEAFITSSSRGIVPVVQIGEQQIGNGQVGDLTRRLMNLYEAEVLSLAEEIIQGG